MIFGALFGALWRAAPEPVAPLPGDANAERVKRALSGERRAFDELYSANVAGVSRLLARLVGTGADRDDLTQQAFLEAFRSLPRFRGDSAFATWLHRIAVNATLAKRRKASVVMESTSTEDEDEAIESDWTLETPLEVNEIESAIERLPEGARDVLVLHAIYGYSHLEAAEMLGVAEGTCKAQLHRARSLLRDKLGVEVR